MKKISIVIPTYNEEKNVEEMVNAVVSFCEKQLSSYDFEIIFIDNASVDNTRLLIRKLCTDNIKIKAIFNTRNFGPSNSPYYGLLQATGDCAILMACDFQEPISLIADFVKKWEEGYKIVIGKKTSSRESSLMWRIRSLYYYMIRKMSINVEQISQFTGFALYDKECLDNFKKLKDPTPFLRGLVAEFGFKRAEVYYSQPLRKAGKTSTSFFRLYDLAMLSFTSYTKIGLRIATFIGFFFSFFSLFVALFYFIYKLFNWNSFSLGMAPLVIGVFFMGGLQLFFLGLISEYIMSINTRIMNRPLVIEEERINF